MSKANNNTNNNTNNNNYCHVDTYNEMTFVEIIYFFDNTGIMQHLFNSVLREILVETSRDK